MGERVLVSGQVGRGGRWPTGTVDGIHVPLLLPPRLFPAACGLDDVRARTPSDVLPMLDMFFPLEGGRQVPDPGHYRAELERARANVAELYRRAGEPARHDRLMRSLAGALRIAPQTSGRDKLMAANLTGLRRIQDEATASALEQPGSRPRPTPGAPFYQYEEGHWTAPAALAHVLREAEPTHPATQRWLTDNAALVGSLAATDADQGTGAPLGPPATPALRPRGDVTGPSGARPAARRHAGRQGRTGR